MPPEKVRVISPYVGWRLRSEELPASADRARCGRRPSARATGEAGRPPRAALSRCQLPPVRPSPHSARCRSVGSNRGRRARDRPADLASRSVSDRLRRDDGAAARHRELPFARASREDRRADARLHARTVGARRRRSRSSRAVDELAYELGQDPVALRLANDTDHRSDLGQAVFLEAHGRVPASAARRVRVGTTDDGARVDARRGRHAGRMGVAAGAYPASTTPAIARLRVVDDGTISIEVGVHEMGQGARNAVAATVADVLNVSAGAGDDTASATRRVHRRTSRPDRGARRPPFPRRAGCARHASRRCRRCDPRRDRAIAPQQILRAAGRPLLEVEARHRAPGVPDAVFARLTQGLLAIAGPEYPEFVSFSYIAHFVEVRVEPRTRRVRVPRVVSVADCGRVVSPRTARSQVRGGVVWGIGASLARGERGRPAIRRVPERRPGGVRHPGATPTSGRSRSISWTSRIRC